jgi:hypothetical protein
MVKSNNRPFASKLHISNRIALYVIILNISDLVKICLSILKDTHYKLLLILIRLQIQHILCNKLCYFLFTIFFQFTHYQLFISYKMCFFSFINLYQFYQVHILSFYNDRNYIYIIFYYNFKTIQCISILNMYTVFFDNPH